MPFGLCTWVDGKPQLDLDHVPDPELRHTGGKWFWLLKSFCYRPPEGDADHAHIYVVSGVDAPLTPTTKRCKQGGVTVVIPPNCEPAKPGDPQKPPGKTDIASVPWIMWWLVASYGNHTRAALLHDALIVGKGTTPAVPRTTADRIFLVALSESKERTSAFRHWLMWAAVAAFGTMRRPLAVVLAFQAIVVWTLVASAVAWASVSAIRELGWRAVPVVAAAVLVVFIVILVFGMLLRAGDGRRRGWLAPLGAVAVVIGVPLSLTWSDPFGFSPTALLLCAAAVALLGFGWALSGAADPALRSWLWPTVLLGMPISLAPSIFILVSVGLVAILDVGAYVAEVIAGKNPPPISVTPYRRL